MILKRVFLTPSLKPNSRLSDPSLWLLDSSTQAAAAEAARRKIAETDAAMVAARADVATAEGKLQEARSA